MKLVPQSTFARLLLLIALLLVLAQVAAALMFRHYISAPAAAQMAQIVADYVEFAAKRARATPAPADAPFRIELEAPVPAGRLPDSHFIRQFRQVLATRFGQAVEVRVSREAAPTLWLHLPPEYGGEWLGMPLQPLESHFPGFRVGLFGLLLGLAALGAYGFARRINRPLQRLATAAEEIGRGVTPTPLPQEGPRELQALASAFNRMAQDVQRLAEDRELLLAGVSHDLRTPLARLRLATELAGDKVDATLIAGMNQDIADMEAIIDQFIAFVRSAEQEPLQATDLNRLVGELCERYARAGERVEAELGDLPPLRLRPLAMQRLLTNLIDNALTHGGGAASVRTRVDTDAVSVSVCDRGPGLPEMEHARLLRPFARLDAARSGARGAGLGLAIAERIARLHRGTLSLHGRPDGGLEARVRLPLSAVGAAP